MTATTTISGGSNSPDSHRAAVRSLVFAIAATCAAVLCGHNTRATTPNFLLTILSVPGRNCPSISLATVREFPQGERMTDPHGTPQIVWGWSGARRCCSPRCRRALFDSNFLELRVVTMPNFYIVNTTLRCSYTSGATHRCRRIHYGNCNSASFAKFQGGEASKGLGIKTGILGSARRKQRRPPFSGYAVALPPFRNLCSGGTNFIRA